MAAKPPLQVRDDDPDPMRVVGERLPHDNPRSIVRDRVIVPLKWFSEETVTIEVAG